MGGRLRQSRCAQHARSTPHPTPQKHTTPPLLACSPVFCRAAGQQEEDPRQLLPALVGRGLPLRLLVLMLLLRLRRLLLVQRLARLLLQHGSHALEQPSAAARKRRPEGLHARGAAGGIVCACMGRGRGAWRA